ncbi:aldehyde dehydrogenase family protein [Paeniglutamicibacter cryotolerans]|uniref:Aldehyde dehydrogenase n=2 Tax=Paeniglutamicibacter cryotolerans TaxID=670079 RepID=A0A839QK99_9MICC|nr:aldehyde dehydrogenase (NAD+) [Paeniglutamicibacter cryotolerans]
MGIFSSRGIAPQTAMATGSDDFDDVPESLDRVESAGIAAVVESLRDAVDTRLAYPRRFRATQLKALERMLDAHEAEFVAALYTDLGKSPVEAKLTELDLVRAEIDHAQLYLSEWMEAKSVKVPLALQPAAAKVQAQPLGLVLIIGPWNYPLQLILAPLVAALAAGNAVVLKPSELAPATSALLAKLVPQFLDRRAVAVIEGGASASSVLLEQKFDHIFYTGGERVGRIVALAAAAQLTPVTLELGGKSPAVVMDGSHVAVARRLAYGKFMNAGQTCVAPDYVLAVGKAAELLEVQLAKAIGGFYGKNPLRSKDYGRIVNLDHFQRLRSYLDQGTVVIGGGFDEDELKIEPTVMIDVDPDSPLMREEIFGPILPIVKVESFDAAVRFINSRPHPLAAYLFSENPRLQSAFEDQVRAGAIVHNAPNMHLAVPGLPFGGVGASGMGAYHGRHGFERFSQLRPVFSKTAVIDTLRAVYPPYTWAKNKIIGKLL